MKKSGLKFKKSEWKKFCNKNIKVCREVFPTHLLFMKISIFQSFERISLARRGEGSVLTAFESMSFNLLTWLTCVAPAS